MVISQAEAASALRDVDQTTARTIEMRAYRHASPHLVLWGLLWIVGYVLMGLLPIERWGLVWLPIDLIGVIGSMILGFRSRAAAGQAAKAAYPAPGPLAISLLFIGLFMAAVYLVFAPTTPEPYLVLPALLLGLIYVVTGSWQMQRLAWVGAAVFLLTIAGFLFMKPWLSFWIAGVGGGGLVLGGLWMRKA